MTNKDGSTSKTYPLNRDQIPAWRRVLSIIIMMLGFQITFYSVVILIQFSIVFFRYDILIIFAVICLVQYPFRKSQWFIRFVNTICRPTLYYSHFEKIYEEPVTSHKVMFAYHPHSVFAFGIYFII